MSFDLANSFGKEKRPFLLISNFDAKRIEVIALDELVNHDIEFCIDENFIQNKHQHLLKKTPISFQAYKQKFDQVIEKIKSGDTYLLNLTQETPIQTLLSFKEIFQLVNAHYKLRYKDEFICFSPEKFIQIKDNKINTFPMKGTIDTSIDNAKEIILHDAKEMAEHTMVVDLLRNDLSIVSQNVKVQRYRYITKIDAGQKELLQVSSHISGDLSENWHENIGTILQKILPVGSISGTPKKSTLDIIKKVENYERGFYSGIFGVYDGKSFDSGVMIRFIQRNKDTLVYKSGGGITLDSDAKSEYEELTQKIYLP